MTDAPNPFDTAEKSAEHYRAQRDEWFEKESEAREAVARALAEHRLMGGRCRCGLDPRLDYYRYEQHVTDAVLDLLPGRSEAEVKAEALRDFAARVRDEMDDSDKVLGTKWATDEYRHGMRSALMQVDEEADRFAAEGGADRG